MLIFLLLSISLGIPKNSIPYMPFGRESAPPDFFSAPAKINPAHATGWGATLSYFE